MIGRRFGKYEILEKIGEGAFGVVYHARDVTLDREVALKLLKPLIAQDTAFRARFFQEAKAAARLDHPNIVDVLEVGELEGSPYIAMRLVEGRPLDEIILEEGPLPLEKVTDILSQVAEALDYAHQRGVVHRDVKPSNIIVREDGRVVLTDFGLARAREESSYLGSAERLVGTVEYMAPEQLDVERKGELGPATDVYALGVVAYQMVTGEVPFSGSTEAVMAGHLFKRPPRPSLRRPDLPRRIEEVILRALAKRPDERYGHAREFASAFWAARPREGRPEPRPAPVGTNIGRFLPWALLALVILLYILRPPSKPERIVERVREVPVEMTRIVEVPVEVTRIVEVPVEVTRIVEVTKEKSQRRCRSKRPQRPRSR